VRRQQATQQQQQLSTSQQRAPQLASQQPAQPPQNVQPQHHHRPQPPVRVLQQPPQQQPVCIMPLSAPLLPPLAQTAAPQFQLHPQQLSQAVTQPIQLAQSFPLTLSLPMCQHQYGTVTVPAIATPAVIPAATTTPLAGGKDLARWKLVAEKAKAAVGAAAAAARAEKARREEEVKQELRSKVRELSSHESGEAGVSGGGNSGSRNTAPGVSASASPAVGSMRAGHGRRTAGARA
jgi:hypothetical protein